MAFMHWKAHLISLGQLIANIWSKIVNYISFFFKSILPQLLISIGI